MKKIISALLLISIFYACTKNKDMPAKQENLEPVSSNNAVSAATTDPLPDTSKNQNKLYIKKKVAKIKYPKPKK